MNFEISENPGAEWDRFAEKHTEILFYYSIWSEVLKRGLGGRPYYVYVKDADGIVCGMSGIILNYSGISLFYSSIPYGGYIGDRSQFRSFMEGFVEKTKFADIIFVSPFSPELDEHYAQHFEATAEAVTRIELKGRGLTDVRSCFEPSVRQSIKKGANLEIEVLRCGDQQSFLTAHRLYLQTMQRNRAIARYSENWFDALYAILAGKREAFVYVASYDGLPVSATVVINSKPGYHLLHSGSSTEHLRLRANDLVVWEIIKDAIAEGKEYVDLMLSDPLDQPLIRWKEKFGGQTVLLQKYRYVNSPLKYALWIQAKKAYPRLQRLMKSFGIGQQ